MSHHRLLPQLITVLREGIPRRQLFADTMAGVIVGLVALPLAIAFAIASGVKPEQGLVTAVVAGFLISLLSGSRVQIGGPTGAFVVLVYSIVAKHGYDGLALATMLAGGLLVAMGLARLGSTIKYIPYPVTVGFTAGIALLIFTSQLRDFFGLRITNPPADFVEKLAAYADHAETLNPIALGIGALSVAIILLWPRLTHRIPGTLPAIIVTTLAVQLLDLPVETIASRFGGVPTMFPVPQLPSFSLLKLREVISPAVSIALLAGIESLLSAVVADGMTEQRHRSNMELIAQGVANIVSPIFGGIPATGAIARTATNIKNGGRTPIAGIVHAVTLLAVMLALGHYASLIPMPTLAAVVIVVAYNMSEWRLFVRTLRSPRSDVLVLLSTFGLTVVVDLTLAIQVGVVLASFLFMRRMAEVTQTRYLRFDGDDADELLADDPERLALRKVPPGVEVFEIAGPFFFGAADKFNDALGVIEKRPDVLILRLRHVPAIDATAVRALETMHNRARRDGTALILSGVQSQPRAVLQRGGFLAAIGADNVVADIDAALKRAKAVQDQLAQPEATSTPR